MAKINLSNLSNLQNEVTATATINANNALISAAVDNSISRDGTQPNQMNSVLDMNSNKIINLPDAFTDQEPVTYGQFVDGITSVNQGVVVDGAFILASHDDTTINDRVLTAGENLEVTDGGPKGNFTISVSDNELNALATTVAASDKLPYFTGTSTADVTDFTSYARTLVDDIDAATARQTLGLVIDTDVQPHDPTLNSLVSAGNGIMAKTALNTITPRTVTGTSNEITITNGDGVAGNPTASLPNSLTFTGKSITGGTFGSTTLNSPSITTPTGIVKGDVGLGNVDNTSDVNKPISTATQTALDAKTAGPVSSVAGRIAIFSDTTGKVLSDGGHVLPTGTVVGTTDSQTLTNKTLTSPAITTPTGIVKGDVGLGNVDNTSDATKNAASVTLTNKTISGSSNTISNIANASLSAAADSTIKSNISGGSASPSDNTITAVLDKQLGTAQGTIAYRGSTAWSALTPGTSGNFLKTQGAAANPMWDSIPGGGDLLSTNNLSDVASSTTALYNLQGAPKKNYIVNGAMMVSQENGTTAGTTFGYYPADGWTTEGSLTSGGTFTVAQVSSRTPGGSPNRIRFTVTATEATPGDDYLAIKQAVEGLRTADLKLGTAAAASLTLQFGVKAPAGTYTCALYDSSGNPHYTTVTITAGEANTDVVKTVQFSGLTTGTWNTNNTTGLIVYIFPLSNTFNFMGTNGNVFELFDVELCEGSSAPDFVVPDYADTLRQCQRYWQKIGGEGSSTAPVVHGYTGAGLNYYVSLTLQTMRASPTGAKFGTWSVSNSSQPSVNVTSTNCVTLTAVATAAGAALFYPANATCYFTLNARL